MRADVGGRPVVVWVGGVVQMISVQFRPVPALLFNYNNTHCVLLFLCELICRDQQALHNKNEVYDIFLGTE